MQILAATDFSTRSSRALRQAGLLAQSGHGQLYVVHVVDDDQPEELIRLEKREAERVLREQVDSMPELRGTQPNLMIVTGYAFDGILRVASELKPHLIVMGSHRKQLLMDIFTGTTIERVIRRGSFPVLMVNFEAQRRYERVVAPIDMSEPSANALRVALSAGLISGNSATLLHAFFAPSKGKLFADEMDRTRVDSYVAAERQQAMDELAKFLVANDLQNSRWSLRVEEGNPMAVITRAVSELRPDLLVMGTHGRSVLAKMLLGSVTEEALRSLNVDILAVPPSKR